MKQSRIDIHSKYKKYNSATDFLLPSLKLNPIMMDYEKKLKKLGFINLFLYDETEGKKEFYPDSLLLIFNPSVSFKEEHWNNFLEVMKAYPVIEYIDYGYYIYGFWIKIHEDFKKNLRYYFKLGKFSQFPSKLHPFMREDVKKICKLDDGYRKNLEKKLGYNEGDFIGTELYDIPDKSSYTFKLEKEC